MTIAKFTKAYTRHYSDNGQTTTYVEWIDTRGKAGRTEGNQYNEHMQALLWRARRQGIPLLHETW